ncbi:MAG: MASE3 domain-containing protein [Pseudomonadota bacterium]
MKPGGMSLLPGMVALAMAFGVLYLASLQSFHLFHILAEFFSIVVGCGAFMMAWNTRRVTENNYILFVGIAYLFVGSLDLLHALTYQGLGVLPMASLDHPIQFWIAARYWEAFVLLLAPLFCNRRLNLPLVWGGFALAAGALVAAIYGGIFPDCYQEGLGTTDFKTISEYVVCAMVALAMLHTHQKRAHFEPRVLKLLLGAMAATILAELSFASYMGLFGVSNKVGHYLKIISFYLIYKATIQASLTRPYETMFLDLSRQEAALREGRRRFETLVEESFDGIYVIQDDHIVFANQAAHQMLGYAPGQMQELKFWLLFHPDYRELTRQRARARLRGEDIVSRYEVIAQRADGSFFEAEISAKAIVLDGKPAVQTWLRDISERKRAEEELRDRAARIKLLLSSTAEGIYGLDLEGHCTFCNPAALRMLGYESEADLLGKNMHEFIHYKRPDGSPYPDEECPIFQAFREGRGTHVDYEVLWRKDGGNFQAEYWSYPLRPDQKVVGAVVTFLDITERKLGMAQLSQAKERAEAASQAKSIFLASMSHEIRTPLNGVIGMTGLLLDGELTAQQRRFAETARASGEALLAIINDILDFSKIEAGRLELERIAFNPRALVEDSLDIVAGKAADKHLELTSIVAPDLPCWLWGDPTRVLQVLVNLLSNALKFTERGEVLVRASLEAPPAGPPRLLVRVVDSGVGVSPENQGKLFQTFSQADSSTTRQYGGTGLGLAICKRLVEMMGGSLGVESAQGQGSTFWFSLPLLEAPAPAEALPEPALPDLEGSRVLLATAHAGLRASLTSMMGPWGVRLSHAADAAQAAEALGRAGSQGGPVALALVDEDLPGLEAARLARAAVAEGAGAPCRLVLMHRLGKVISGQTLLRDGYAAALSKPVRQSRLLEVVTSPPSAPLSLPEGSSPSEATTNTHRLLLAEDNPVNQQVALHLLCRQGYRVDVVANGLEAVEAVGNRPYDLVLMDCQMPEMDGYEATMTIRRLEGPAKHIPIVAMTANALAGDREKCLAAGMNDYVSKPVRASELAAALARQLAPVRPLAESPAASGADAAWPVFDKADLLARVEGDQDILAAVVGVFREGISGRLARLRQALQEGDAALLGQHAHGFKGEFANLSAPAARQVVARLEASAQAGDLGLAGQLVAQLEDEAARLLSALRGE